MNVRRIRSLRERDRLTQDELAKKIGVSRSSINAWEMGISIPSIQYLKQLANTFKVSTDYILEIDKTSSIDISGLSEADTQLVYAITAHLRNKHNS